MKKIITLPLLVFFLQCFAQQYSLSNCTFIGTTHLEAYSGNVKRINTRMTVTYSGDYCGFQLEGGPLTTFMVQGVERAIMSNGAVSESFISAPNWHTPMGKYDVVIVRDGKGVSVTINMPNVGVAYIITRAEVIVHGKKVSEAQYHKDLKALEGDVMYQDSLLKAAEARQFEKEKKQRIEDSIYRVQKDSIQNAQLAQLLENHYQSGDNYYDLNIEWLLDTIAAKVKVGPDDYFYNDFKILIDSNGYITRAVRANNMGNIQEKYLPMINRAIEGIKVTPFSVNSKHYPSYCMLHIILIPGTGTNANTGTNNGEKSKKKGHILLKTIFNNLWLGVLVISRLR
jgi:hypothetical protein